MSMYLVICINAAGSGWLAATGQRVLRHKLIQAGLQSGVFGMQA